MQARTHQRVSVHPFFSFSFFLAFSSPLLATAAGTFAFSLSHFHYFFFPFRFRGFDPLQPVANTTHRQAKQASPFHPTHSHTFDRLATTSAPTKSSVGATLTLTPHDDDKASTFSVKFGSNAPFLESSDSSKSRNQKPVTTLNTPAQPNSVRSILRSHPPPPLAQLHQSNSDSALGPPRLPRPTPFRVRVV